MNTERQEQLEDAPFGFDRVGKRFGEKVAVREVSFLGRRGEILGLLGPNGAGKTTLIRILLDILRPSAGTAWLFGEPLDRKHLDRIGYLPEERGLYSKLKVQQVLVYFATLKGLERREAKRRAKLWLERMQLPDVLNYRVDRLSKGMSQKVQLAGTLLCEPELCVLDEPFSGLDPVNVRLVKDLILERKEAGLTTVLSTHQMSMVEELCDRVALIHDGCLVVDGPVAEVRREHSPLEVDVILFGGLPELSQVHSVSPMPPRFGQAEGASCLRLGLTSGTRPSDVIAQLLEAGCRVEHFEQVLAGMEDVFLHAVGAAA